MYDTVGVRTVGGEAAFDLGSAWSFAGGLKLHRYTLPSEDRAWNLPNTTWNASATYRLIEGLSLTANASYVGERYSVTRSDNYGDTTPDQGDYELRLPGIPRREPHRQLHLQRPPRWVVDIRQHRQCQIRDLGWIPCPRVSGSGRCALRLLTSYPQSCENPGFFVEKSGFFMPQMPNPEGGFHPTFTGRIFRDVRREQESWANGI